MLRGDETRKSRRLWFAAIAAGVLGVCGCGGQPDVVGLVVAPINNGQPWVTTQDMSAIAFFRDGSQEEVAPAAEWASSDSSVATVSAGVVTRVMSGYVFISALYGGHQASVELAVP